MFRLTVVVVLLALAGCDGPQDGQPMDPGTRAALLGALIANQPHPYYQQPYQMPVYQRMQTTCMRMGAMLECN